MANFLLVVAAAFFPLLVAEGILRWRPVVPVVERPEVERPEAAADRIPVLVLGDSFAEGAGLAHRGLRFSDRLQSRIASTHRITLLAKGGWDTKAEYVALTEFPIVPKVLVLSYYPNDIDSAAAHHGVSYVGTETSAVPALSRVGRWIKSNSRLAGWLIRRFPREDRGTYREYVRRAFDDAAVWREHRADLDAIARWTARHGARLIVVLFPFLVDLEFSAPRLERVASHFRELGIEILDVSELVARMPLGERIVSEEDPHASAAVHRLVAEALASRINPAPLSTP